MWERYNISAQQALSQGRPVEAENLFRQALNEAEQMGPTEPKIVQSLNNLANCMRQQGKHNDAEPLYQRAIKMKEMAGGHFHKDLVMLLENYAKSLRANGRGPEADKLESRAQAIFAKK